MLLTVAATAALFTQVAACSAKPMPADVGPGRVAWFDITTTDLAKSQTFYGALFGWTFRAVRGTSLAVEIVAAGTAVGTIRVADGAISPHSGVVYVQVDDIRRSMLIAQDLGGSVAPGFPFDLPDGTGAVGLVTDPIGHPVGLYSRAPLGTH